jgi:hypothetical protein
MLDGPIALQLETLGTPGLDEAEQMIRTVVPHAISTKIHCGLTPDADELLLDWLVNRHVESADGIRKQLPYQYLEDWLAIDDGTVAEALGTRYLEALVIEINANDKVSFDVDSAIIRAKSIFEKQMPAGEETRRILWEILPLYLESSHSRAVEAAWAIGVPALGKANDEQASAFVSAFASRLLSSYGGEPVDLNIAFDFVARAVTDRLHSLKQETLTQVVSLTNQWSNDDSTADKACDMAQRLVALGMDIEGQIIANWAARLMTTLPLLCVQFIATRFADQSGPVKATIVSTLNATTAAATVVDAAQARLKAFVDAMPPEKWSISPLVECLNAVLAHFSARFANPNSYLDSVFPIFAQILSRATPANYGSSIQHLFTQARAHAPNVYPLIHGWMDGNWPQAAAERNPYDPLAIFEEAANFVQAYSTQPNGRVLRSMRDMLDREIVPAAKVPRLLDTACIVWKVAPTETTEIISAYPQLSAPQASQLILSIDGSKEEQLSALKQTWMHVSRSMDAKDNADTFRVLLTSNPVTTFDETDAGITIWLDSQTDAGKSLLSASLIAKDIMDEQRLRLWRQASRRAEKFGAEFLLSAVPAVLVLSPIEMTATALFNDKERLTALLKTSENQSKLARELMIAFPSAKTNTVKTEIANYSSALAGQAVLKSFKPGNLTSDEFKIIEGVFTKSSELSRLQKLVLES